MNADSNDFTETELSPLVSLELLYGQAANEPVLAEAIPWIRLTAEHAVTSLPFGLIVDIGRLFSSDVLLQPSAGEYHRLETEAAYEDDFLRRLAAEPDFVRAKDALMRLDEAAHNEAIAYLVHALVGRLGFQPARRLSPAVTRRLLRLSSAALLQKLSDGLQQYPQLIDQARADYRQIARLARHVPRLLTDNDVLTVENIGMLRTLTQRTRFSQVVDVAARMELALPRRIKARGEETGLIATRIQDDNDYPVGGFTSITNSGSLENLVSSELIYMDQTQEFDLFDVRYSEGDLLYFARDEDTYFRSLRDYAFLLHPDLQHARIKHSELPYQDMVLVLGMLLCMVRRLSSWLGNDELKIRLVFLHSAGDNTPLAQEFQQARLLFREWVDSGCVQIQSCVREEVDCPNVILFSHGAAPAASQPVLLHCNVYQHRVALWDQDLREVPLNEAPSLFDHWTAALRELLGRLY